MLRGRSSSTAAAAAAAPVRLEHAALVAAFELERRSHLSFGGEEGEEEEETFQDLLQKRGTKVRGNAGERAEIA